MSRSTPSHDELILLMDQVNCFVLGEMFLQALFDILHTGSRAVRDDDDRAIDRKVPENAEESFDTFTFVRNDESGVGKAPSVISRNCLGGKPALNVTPIM